MIVVLVAADFSICAIAIRTFWSAKMDGRTTKKWNNNNRTICSMLLLLYHRHLIEITSLSGDTVLYVPYEMTINRTHKSKEVERWWFVSSFWPSLCNEFFDALVEDIHEFRSFSPSQNFKKGKLVIHHHGSYMYCVMDYTHDSHAMYDYYNKIFNCAS